MTTKKDPNPVLGYLTDAQGHRASVHQVKGGPRRGYLYLRCDECGTDQRVGAELQRTWWHETQWIDGAPAETPPKVAEAPDWTPGANVVPNPGPVQPKSTEQPTEETGGGARLGLGLAGVAGLVGALWLILKGGA